MVTFPNHPYFINLLLPSPMAYDGLVLTEWIITLGKKLSISKPSRRTQYISLTCILHFLTKQSWLYFLDEYILNIYFLFRGRMTKPCNYLEMYTCILMIFYIQEIINQASPFHIAINTLKKRIRCTDVSLRLTKKSICISPQSRTLLNNTWKCINAIVLSLYNLNVKPYRNKWQTHE